VIGDGSYQYASQPKNARSRQRGNDVSDFGHRPGQAEGAHQRRDKRPALSHVFADLLVLGDLLEEFRRFRPDIFLRSSFAA
jgi:hypothetical protein